MNAVRVLLVAGDPLARAGLAALLAGQEGCTVVGQVADEGDLAADLDVYRPEVIVWDLGWGDAAPDLARLADWVEAGPPVVALLPDGDPAADLWTAGARGLLLRSAGAERLVAALAAVAQGWAVLDPALAGLLARSPAAPPLEELTPREREVLRLLAEGLPNKVIARRLEISEHTVKFHLNAILGKLHAQSRTEAVVQAIRLGLVAL